MADGLKEEETFQVNFRGDGPLRGVLAMANGKLEARGYVGNPAVTLPPNALASVTGMPKRPPNLSYAGNRRHSRNHARTNLNGRYLFASVPIGHQSTATFLYHSTVSRSPARRSEGAGQAVRIRAADRGRPDAARPGVAGGASTLVAAGSRSP